MFEDPFEFLVEDTPLGLDIFSRSDAVQNDASLAPQPSDFAHHIGTSDLFTKAGKPGEGQAVEVESSEKFSYVVNLSDKTSDRASNSRSGKKKAGRKPQNTGLTLRKDLVLKTLLRRIRNYYWKDFKTCTKFNTRKAKEDITAIEECLQEYAYKRFKAADNQELIFWLGSIMSTKNSRNLFIAALNNFDSSAASMKDTIAEKVEEVHQVLYKFSFYKFQRMAKNQVFSFLIANYAQVIDRSTLTEDEVIGLEMLLAECYK